jgi:hypothetical protein
VYARCLMCVCETGGISSRRREGDSRERMVDCRMRTLMGWRDTLDIPTSRRRILSVSNREHSPQRSNQRNLK